MPFYILLLFQVFLPSLHTPSETAINGTQNTNLSVDRQSCILPEHYPEIERMVQNNRKELIQKGNLPSSYHSRMAAPAFIWPVRQATGFNYPSYYSINNFVDLDPVQNSVLDWNCGARTYDGHRGIDINNWPFWWHMMDNDQVEAIAAADGVIIAKLDGAPDRNCTCIEPWNVIMIEHEDGYQSWYAHLKSGSLTAKGVGESVIAGEYLGVIGSAGCSSNPHLHFEVRDPDFNFIEPYFGPCNNLPTGSLWANQKPYHEGTLNAVFTHSDVPSIAFCPEDEQTNFKNSFEPGELAYFVTYLHDMQLGEVLDLQIIDANGLVVYDWDFTSPVTHTQPWWYWNWFIPEDRPLGQWQFKANYKLQEVIHFFDVVCKSELNLSDITITEIRDFEASQRITTANIVKILGGGNVNMRAGAYLQFTPGFSVEEGGILRAFIDDCSDIQERQLSEDGEITDRQQQRTTISNTGLDPIGAQRRTPDLDIHPNPANDLVNLSYYPLSLNPVQIQFFDLNGRLVQQFKHHPFDENMQMLKVDISTLENGLHLIRLISNGEQATKRFMKGK